MGDTAQTPGRAELTQTELDLSGGGARAKLTFSKITLGTWDGGSVGGLWGGGYRGSAQEAQ